MLDEWVCLLDGCKQTCFPDAIPTRVILRPYDLIWIYPDCLCDYGSKYDVL